MGKGKKKRMAKADRAAVTKAAKAIKAAKPRNPQDATLRNTRAAAGRVEALHKPIIEQGLAIAGIAALQNRMADTLTKLTTQLGTVLARLDSLEAQARSAAPAPLIPAP